MDFTSQVRTLAQNFEKIKENVKTEEATKVSMVMPFLQVLGYNPFDPTEVVPEFVADVGIKKGEKVDYAIFINGKPLILVEAKCAGTQLDVHAGQLLRYFGVTPSRFAILTNGTEYQFFTDLEEKNRMDAKPFLTVDLSPTMRDGAIAELHRFHKEKFDAEGILSSAQELKYTGEIKRYFRQQLAEPEEDFTRFAIKKIYDGMVTKSVFDRLEPLVRSALKQVTNDMIHDRLQGALDETRQSEKAEAEATAQPAPHDDGVVTTQEELEAFYAIRAILFRSLAGKTVDYKDTKSYFSVNLDGSVWRWICRLRFTPTQKSIQFRVREGKLTWTPLNSMDELFELGPQLAEALECAKAVGGE